MGKAAPSEFIIASISAGVCFVFFPPLIPLFHRISHRSQRRVILFLALATLSAFAFLVSGPTYDSMHPKRVGVQYAYNVSSRS